MPASQVLLVTGSSSGIGLATALEAARRGHRVYASARRPEALPKELAAAGAAALALDVDGARRRRARRRGDPRQGGPPGRARQQRRLRAVRRDRGRVGRRVAAAVRGQLLRRARDDPRGPPRDAHGAAGNDRRHHLGRRPVTIPFAAPYCASKHALESLCDSLRVEVAPFGIRVVVRRARPHHDAVRRPGARARPADPRPARPVLPDLPRRGEGDEGRLPDRASSRPKPSRASSWTPIESRQAEDPLPRDEHVEGPDPAARPAARIASSTRRCGCRSRSRNASSVVGPGGLEPPT